jgi:branched-subunit amino acid transport protein
MTPSEYVLIAGMAAVTFAIRYFLFALADRIRMAPLIEASLRFIPPAVLTAIVLPAVLLPKGGWDLSWSNPHLAAALAAAVAGVGTRNLLATIGVGLGTFFLHRWWL